MSDPDYALSGRGAALFRDLTEMYDFAPHELAILIDACRTLTLADRLEQELVDAPTIVLGSQRQPVASPLFGEVRQQRTTFAALLAKLALPELDDNGDTIDLATARSQLARKAASARWGRS